MPAITLFAVFACFYKAILNYREPAFNEDIYIPLKLKQLGYETLSKRRFGEVDPTLLYAQVVRKYYDL